MYMGEQCLQVLLECLADIENTIGDSSSGPGKMIAQLSEPIRRLYRDIDDNEEVIESLETLRNRNWR